MDNNLITLYDKEGNTKQYKILLIIEKDYKYIIYTDLDNSNIKRNLYAVKLNSLTSNEAIQIDDLEWEMIEKEYNNLIK